MDQQSLFAVKDMLGNEIRPGSTLLFPKGNELKLAEVDEINVGVSRNSPSKPTVRLRVVGRYNDKRYIGSATTISNPERYVALEVTPAREATATEAAQPATMRVPGNAANMLIGAAIN